MKTVILSIVLGLISQGAFAATKTGCNKRMIHAAESLYNGNAAAIQGSSPAWDPPKFVRETANGSQFRVVGSDGNEDNETWNMRYLVTIVPSSCQVLSIQDLDFKRAEKQERPSAKALQNCKALLSETVSEFALASYRKGVRVENFDVAFDVPNPGTTTVYLELCDKGGCGGNSYGVKADFNDSSCFIGSIELTGEE